MSRIASLHYTPMLDQTPGSAYAIYNAGMKHQPDWLQWHTALENQISPKRVALCDLLARLHYLLDNLPLEVPNPGELCSSRAHQVWTYEVYLLQDEIRRRIQRGLRD